MKREVWRLNWQGNADQFEYEKYYPGNNQLDFRISGPRGRISHGHIIMKDIEVGSSRLEDILPEHLIPSAAHRVSEENLFVFL